MSVDQDIAYSLDLKTAFRVSKSTGWLVRLLDNRYSTPRNIRSAIEAGADLTWVSKAGVPLLVHAIKSASREVDASLCEKIDILLKAGTAILPSRAKETALSCALMVPEHSTELISLLLSHGADPNEVLSDVSGILDHAISCQNLGAVKTLLASGAYPDGLSGKSVVLAIEASAPSAKSSIAQDMVRALLEAGATPNPQSLISPLFSAIQFRMVGCSVALIEFGADPDWLNPNSPESKNTPRKMATSIFDEYQSQGVPWLLGLDGLPFSKIIAALEYASLDRGTAPAIASSRGMRL